MEINISMQDARQMVLQAQVLLQLSKHSSKAGALAVIEHLGYVQIDTLAVVARAHHHTLWTRVPDYREEHLHELQVQDKRIFEYWSHAASYLPMRDFRYSLVVKEQYASGKSHWFRQNKDIKQYVLDRIEAEGALQSKDFEEKQAAKRKMWEWKDAKRALEQLFMEGRLMVAARKGFQKVYDLSERVLPDWVDTTQPTDEDFATYLVQTALRSQGLVMEADIYYLRPQWKKKVQTALQQMQESGEVVLVSIKGREKENWYALRRCVFTFLETPKAKTIPELHLLTPFDSLVIQRKRILRLFDFDYQIECYVPEAKRKYGYYCLPVLWGNRFIGRLDPKADRKAGVLYVKKWFTEIDAPAQEIWMPALREKLLEFAHFNGCNRVEWVDM